MKLTVAHVLHLKEAARILMEDADKRSEDAHGTPEKERLLPIFNAAQAFEHHVHELLGVELVKT